VAIHGWAVVDETQVTTMNRPVSIHPLNTLITRFVLGSDASTTAEKMMATSRSSHSQKGLFHDFGAREVSLLS